MTKLCCSRHYSAQAYLVALLVMESTALGCSAAAVSLARASIVAAAIATRPTEGPVEAVLFSVGSLLCCLPASVQEGAATLSHADFAPILGSCFEASFVPARPLQLKEFLDLLLWTLTWAAVL